jgi:AcrR family transcriptional regulator
VTLPGPLAKQPVGRERLSRDTIEQHQRERILTAAVGVFAKRGFQQTTIDHIVAAAKTSVGSFYGLFDGKEDCFLQCYDRVAATARERIEQALPEGSWQERTCSTLASILAEVEADPMAARIVLVEAATAGPGGLGRYEQTLDSLLPALRVGRSLAPAGDELPASLEEASVAGTAWLLRDRLVSGRVKKVAELLPELAAIVIGPYLGEAAARRLASASS